MTALVAGGAGRIGSTMSAPRLWSGAEVLAIHPDLRPVLDGATHVFHLAAQAGVRKSWGADFRIGTELNIDATQILLETGVGRPTERFIYFTFVADAARATADVGSRGTPGRVYNIGGGSRATLLDVFEILGRASGRPLDIDRQPPQKDDMRDTYADTTLARADLGCALPVTREQGLTAMDQWFVTRPS